MKTTLLRCPEGPPSMLSSTISSFCDLKWRLLLDFEPIGSWQNVKWFCGTIAWWQPCSGPRKVHHDCYLSWYQAGGSYGCQQRPYQTVGLFWIKLGMQTLNHPEIIMEVKPLINSWGLSPLAGFSTQVATGPFGMKHGMAIVSGGLSFQSTWLASLTDQILQPEHAQDGLSAGLNYSFPRTGML